MTYAFVVVRDGVVVEQHQTQDPAVSARLNESGAIAVDGLSPLPGCGWTYTEGVFTAPAE